MTRCLPAAAKGGVTGAKAKLEVTFGGGSDADLSAEANEALTGRFEIKSNQPGQEASIGLSGGFLFQIQDIFQPGHYFVNCAGRATHDLTFHRGSVNYRLFYRLKHMFLRGIGALFSRIFA